MENWYSRDMLFCRFYAFQLGSKITGCFSISKINAKRIFLELKRNKLGAKRQKVKLFRVFFEAKKQAFLALWCKKIG